jgi:hypothetical protein
LPSRQNELGFPDRSKRKTKQLTGQGISNAYGCEFHSLMPKRYRRIWIVAIVASNIKGSIRRWPIHKRTISYNKAICAIGHNHIVGRTGRAIPLFFTKSPSIVVFVRRPFRAYRLESDSCESVQTPDFWRMTMSQY